MPIYPTQDRLVIFDADGTLIDAFSAIEQTFLRHGMAIGDLERFQRRRKLLKYLGGLREFPTNLRHQFGKQSRKELLATLSDYYREEAGLYPGMTYLLRTLLATPSIRVALVTRNITNEPRTTLSRLFARHGIDLDAFDHVACLPLSAAKSEEFRAIRTRLAINPARAFACGDENGDYLAAIAAGIHPLIAAYGFENFERLNVKFGIPEEIISETPADLTARLLHAIDLTPSVATLCEEPFSEFD